MKKIIYALTLILCVIFAILIFMSFRKPMHPEFDLSQYAQYIDANTETWEFESVPTATDAEKIAKTVWSEIYGDQYFGIKRFSVSYDINSRAWLVRGNFPYFSINEGFNLRLGGTPYIIIEQDSGIVLAVWHDK